MTWLGAFGYLNDLTKGGVGSGVKGHKTQQTKGQRLSYTAEKKRWMKEKLTPEQKKQLEDIKKIEQELADKRQEFNIAIDHDIWVNSVKDSRAKLKEIKQNLRLAISKKRKGVHNFEIEEAEQNFLNAKPDMQNALGLELIRIKNRYNPDDQQGPPETWIKYNEKTQEELKEKDEKNILALHKDADIKEIDFLKGGKGSGIKGHRTYKEEIRKFKKELEGINIHKFKELFKEAADDNLLGWYSDYDGMKKFENVVTATFRLSEEDQREPKEALPSLKVLKMYAITQEYLERKYPDGKVKLYRGIDTSAGEEGFFGEADYGKNILKVNTSNVSSWTLKKNVADSFAKGEMMVVPNFLRERTGLTISALVPIKQILVHPDLTNHYAADSTHGISEATIITKDGIWAKTEESFSFEEGEEDEEYY